MYSGEWSLTHSMLYYNQTSCTTSTGTISNIIVLWVLNHES